MQKYRDLKIRVSDKTQLLKRSRLLNSNCRQTCEVFISIFSMRSISCSVISPASTRWNRVGNLFFTGTAIILDTNIITTLLSQLTTLLSRLTTLLSQLTTLLFWLTTLLSRLKTLLSRLKTLLSWLSTLLSRLKNLLSWLTT